MAMASAIMVTATGVTSEARNPFGMLLVTAVCLGLAGFGVFLAARAPI